MIRLVTQRLKRDGTPETMMGNWNQTFDSPADFPSMGLWKNVKLLVEIPSLQKCSLKVKDGLTGIITEITITITE